MRYITFYVSCDEIDAKLNHYSAYRVASCVFVRYCESIGADMFFVIMERI